MSRIDLGAYKAILATKPALRFDAGTFLMRMFNFTATIGPIAMLTLAGASAFEATTVSSTLAACTFLVAPRVSRLVDKRGQSAIVPLAAVIGLAGFVLMMCVTQFGLPFWLNYPAAFLGSFLPHGPSLARTRWTYLVETRCLGGQTPELKSAYAFEGILDDVAFMVGPACSIGIAAATVPIGGVAAGVVVYAIGCAIMVSSKNTEPDAAYLQEHAKAEGASQGRNVLTAYPMVLLLFISMVLVGCVYGGFDASSVSYAESIGWPVLASIMLAIQSVFSLVMSTLFGMVRLSMPLHRQLIVFGVLFGALYALLVFIETPASFLIITSVAAISYPPLLITANVVCETSVPEANLTEAMSWMTSGLNVGMVIGPVSAGALIDATTMPLAGFDLCAVFAGLLVVLFVAAVPLVRRMRKRTGE